MDFSKCSNLWGSKKEKKHWTCPVYQVLKYVNIILSQNNRNTDGSGCDWFAEGNTCKKQ
jgi:hypothetical protein